VDAAGRAYASDTATYQFFTQALDAVRRVPGVTAAAFSSQLPLSGDLEAYGVQFDRGAGGDPNEDGPAFRYAVTPDYFATMRIPLRRGRLLDAGDRPGGPAAVLINESLARRRFPGQDPIGKRVRIGPQIDRADLPPSMVVGVVGDVKQVSLAAGQADAVYLAMGQWIWVDNLQTLVVRTRVDAALLAPAVKRAIWSVDAGRAIVRVATMDGLLDRLAAQRRFALIVFETFALAALALAAIGIYGVLAGSVADRTREIGIRAALGASRGSIVSLVLRQGLTLTGLGVGLGLCGAVAASRALVSLLFGVSRLDPLTYLGVVALLWLVSAAACGVPAWRAARIDPSITLQAQ
jgi:putative ABC transport system permease protein